MEETATKAERASTKMMQVKYMSKRINQKFRAIVSGMNERGIFVEIKENIKTIGLFNTKADNVLKTCHILLKNHKGEVPRTREKLEALPGVGRKTANAGLNMWWRHPAQAVDTHIFRVGNRTKIAPGKTVEDVERAVEDHIPADFQLHAHHWMIIHGRYHCKARKPLCATCAREG